MLISSRDAKEIRTRVWIFQRESISLVKFHFASGVNDDTVGRADSKILPAETELEELSPNYFAKFNRKRLVTLITDLTSF